jgi:hypothetical protein
MANSKPKKHNLKSIFMLIFVLALSLLVLIEIGANIANEVGDQNQARATAISPDSGISISVEPTPTLFEMLPLE